MESRAHFIGGTWGTSSDGEYEVVNPSTEAVIARVPESSALDVEQAAKSARDAQPEWAGMSRHNRQDLLLGVARELQIRQSELTETIVAESGAVLNRVANGEVPTAVAKFDRYSRTNVGDFDQMLPEHRSSNGEDGIAGFAARAPIGVVACITPYNFPLPNMASKIAPALVAGNTVVMKPAPQDPLAVLELASVCEKVGIPPGVVNVVTGSGATQGRILTESQDIDMVSFTGSSQVGTRIYAGAARTMKRLLLELGGKSACVICEDADLDKAVSALSRVWMFHSGQVCRLPTRAIVHRSVYNEVNERLASVASQLVIGPPEETSTVVGPVISSVQRHTIEGYVKSGIQAGARLLCGGNRPAFERGYYVAPALLADCSMEMTIAQNEVFGPVLITMPYDDDSEAIQLANASPFGLYSYVFSADAEHGCSVAAQLRSGAVSINTDLLHPEAPFGGVGLSGIGRDGGDYSILSYTEPRATLWRTN